MEKQFCGYEIALQLKELGFDEKCFGYFEIAEKIKIEVSYNSDPNLIRRDFIAAPLWQQVISWFREKHKINMLFIQSNHTGCWMYTLEGINDGKEYHDLYRSYQVVREQAILKAIELIKDIK